jgi:hypothetical protein
VNKLELDTQTDQTGSLQVRLPGRQAAYRVRVTIEWDPAELEKDDHGWPAGWFDATAGAIDDPSFRRPEQGVAELREGLE